MERANLRYDLGYTQKFWSDRFNREFENTTLDTFDPDKAVRCEDRYGDQGWIVGYHEKITLQRGETLPWWWVVRDRDNALVGIHESQMTWKGKNK